MSAYDTVRQKLAAEPKTWLVTGVAGFIGSHLLETLLQMDQRVVGLDNFATGRKQNLEEVSRLVRPEQWARFNLLNGDILDLALCRKACAGVDYVLHQAALGSVPRSIENPVASHEANVTGFLNMLVAARDQKVKRFVYASSSSVYGDDPSTFSVETTECRPLSPYAATKVVNEVYAKVFARTYGLESIGLRYFNVFGPRQNPEGPYAAVIPNWASAMLRQQTVHINGDGATSRDFCFVANVVQANLLAATTQNMEALNRVYNVATGGRVTLNELFTLLNQRLAPTNRHLKDYHPEYRPFRAGDPRYRSGDISLAKNLLGYEPTHNFEQGLDAAVKWYQS